MSKTETGTETYTEALRLADEFEICASYKSLPLANDVAKVAVVLRRLDAENKALRERLEASGAVPVVLGKKLFQFNCHQDWVNRAQRAWKMAGVRSEDTICLDQKGRVLRKGLEFARAHKEGAFPVVVYLALVDDTAAHDAWLDAKNGGAA